MSAKAWSYYPGVNMPQLCFWVKAAAGAGFAPVL